MSDLARGKIGGAPNTNRTCDLPLRRGLLYPLSYRGAAGEIIARRVREGGLLQSAIWRTNRQNLMSSRMPKERNASRAGVHVVVVTLTTGFGARALQAPRPVNPV